MTLHPNPLNFLIYDENSILFFISAHAHIAINILQYIKLGSDIGRRMPVYCLFFIVKRTLKYATIFCIVSCIYKILVLRFYVASRCIA
jgi:hypothetical protein